MEILLVDDAQNIRNNLKRFISELKGVKVSGEADDYNSAIEIINNTKPDIIILDIELKNSSGFDVLKYVREDGNYYNPVIIMFTNHPKLYEEKALGWKADYFFNKTTELDKLLGTIKKLGILDYGSK